MEFEFKTKVWLYNGPREQSYFKSGKARPAARHSLFAPWHFITVPIKVGKQIRELFGESKRGFGSIRVTVTIGNTSWKTSIFPDKKTKSYLLPIKFEARKKENINLNQAITISLKIDY